MRAVLLISLLALLNTPVSSMAAEKTSGDVNGTDTRVRATPKDFPWLGKVILPAGNWCSGTLIAPRLVLSAGHCFAKVNGQSTNYQATAFQRIGSKQAVVGRSIEGKRYLSETGELADWSLIALDKPIQMPSYPKVAAFDFKRVRSVTILGYPVEKEGPQIDRNCEIGGPLGDYGSSFFHFCIVGHGQSGGPLVVNIGSSQPVVVAVNSFGRKGFLFFGHNDNVAFGLGAKEVELIKSYIRQYR